MVFSVPGFGHDVRHRRVVRGRPDSRRRRPQDKGGPPHPQPQVPVQGEGGQQDRAVGCIGNVVFADLGAFRGKDTVRDFLVLPVCDSMLQVFRQYLHVVSDDIMRESHQGQVNISRWNAERTNLLDDLRNIDPAEAPVFEEIESATIVRPSKRGYWSSFRGLQCYQNAPINSA